MYKRQVLSGTVVDMKKIYIDLASFQQLDFVAQYSGDSRARMHVCAIDSVCVSNRLRAA